MDIFSSALYSLFFVPFALLAAIPLFLYVYVILRWRAGSAEEPGLGSYSLMLTFRLCAILIGLGALSMLLYAGFSQHDHDDMKRVCWPLLIAALIFLGIQLGVGALLGASGRFAAARRIFGGGLVAVSGFVTLGALVAVLITVWEKLPERVREPHAGDRADRLVAFLCWLVCFGGVYFASAFLMARASEPFPREVRVP